MNPVAKCFYRRKGLLCRTKFLPYKVNSTLKVNNMANRKSWTLSFCKKKKWRKSYQICHFPKKAYFFHFKKKKKKIYFCRLNRQSIVTISSPISLKEKKNKKRRKKGKNISLSSFYEIGCVVYGVISLRSSLHSLGPGCHTTRSR